MRGNASIPTGANVVFIDGKCVLCHRLVSFILDHDPRGLFLFAHLQGALARDVLGRHGRNASDVDSVHVLTDAGTAQERLLWAGRAARAIASRLFRFGAVLRWVPLTVLDAAYRALAKHRYQLFGKYDQCRVPAPEQRGRFLDVGDP